MDMDMEVTQSQREEWYKIFRAAEAGHEGKLDELVSQGVNLDVQIIDVNRCTSVLHMLAKRGIMRGTELLIRKGANIEMPCGKDARTALHIAALHEHAELVQMLIDLGANVHSRTRINLSMPLHLVAQRGSSSLSSLQILRCLLKHGGASDVLVRDADGNTPLHCAALNTTGPHMIMIKELLNYILHESAAIFLSGADGSLFTSSPFNMQNHEGQTPLHFAAGIGDDETARLFLEAGASRHALDAYGATPFHYAARSGNLCLLDMFNVQDLDAPATKNQFTALHYAAWNNCDDAVKWLLEHGASVNVIDKYKGDSPLHLAARRGNAQVIQTLIIEGGADILLTNKKGELALGLADDRGHHEAARSFVKAVILSSKHIMLKDLSIKHSSNGASLLHYFAAYGRERDMEFILGIIKHKMSNFNINYGELAHDKSNRNAVHWAALKGNIDSLRILAQNNADLNADMNDQGKFDPNGPKTPLYLALLNWNKDFAAELLKLMPESEAFPSQDCLLDISGKWMMDYYKQDAKLKVKLGKLQVGFKKHKFPPNISNDTLFSEIPRLYLALYAEREDIAKFFQEHSKGGDDAVNERGKQSGRTSLHWATLLGERTIVAQLCRKDFKDDLTANVEDKLGKTALEYAKKMRATDIEKELMRRSDVGAYIDGLYKDRQLYVDAANAILVGAALIAGVTFAGWLQPPLGYANYYNLPKLSAHPGADAFQTYAAIQQHAGVRWFWVSNDLSFSFAIATVLAGLVAVVPVPGVYIANSVAHLRRCLLVAAVLLGISIMFVLVAFAAAGFAILPPLFKYQAIMLATTIVGAIPCVVLFIWFWRRLTFLLPEWLRTMKAKHMWKLISINTYSRLGHQGEECSTSSAYSQGCVPQEDAPEQIVVESSRAPTSKESTDGTGSVELYKDDDVEPYEDGDYIVGENYDKYPWDDGLNVPPVVMNPEPETSCHLPLLLCGVT